MSKPTCTIIAGSRGMAMTEIEKKAETALSSLNKSVHEALDKKRRLGQYAVVWKDKKVIRIFEQDQSKSKKK